MQQQDMLQVYINISWSFHIDFILFLVIKINIRIQWIIIYIEHAQGRLRKGICIYCLVYV